MKLEELTRDELLVLAKDQQTNIEGLREMLWMVAGVEDSPAITEADFEEALKLSAEQRITHILKELEANRGKDEEGGQCSA